MHRLGRADLHVHSHWSDGRQSPEALVLAAAGRVDILAVTDHDEVGGALLARRFARARPELGVDVVVGEEVSTLNGHLLALFIEERIPPGLTAETTVDLIHRQGGLAVVPHPLHPIRYARRGHRPLAELLEALPVDAVEVVNNSGPLACFLRRARARRQRPLAPTRLRGQRRPRRALRRQRADALRGPRRGRPAPRAGGRPHARAPELVVDAGTAPGSRPPEVR